MSWLHAFELMCYSIVVIMLVNLICKVDVYPTGFHAFDMLLPFRRISRKAIAEFEKQYLYAAEHYSAPQENGRAC